MIRVVLAALLSAAVVATALPAVERAQRHRAAELATDELADLRDAAERLAAANDPAPPGTSGATRAVAVRVPRGVTLELGADGLSWRRGAHDQRLRVEVPLSGNVTLAERGRHRLRLSLVREGGVERVAVRRFKPEPAANRSRVRSSL